MNPLKNHVRGAFEILHPSICPQFGSSQTLTKIQKQTNKQKLGRCYFEPCFARWGNWVTQRWSDLIVQQRHWIWTQTVWLQKALHYCFLLWTLLGGTWQLQTVTGYRISEVTISRRDGNSGCWEWERQSALGGSPTRLWNPGEAPSSVDPNHRIPGLQRTSGSRNLHLPTPTTTSRRQETEEVGFIKIVTDANLQDVTQESQFKPQCGNGGGVFFKDATKG